MMELGNFCFGNSRGNVPLDRDERFEGPLFTLLEECCGDTRGGSGFENDTFKVMPYYWGDCVCGQNDEELGGHADACPIDKPNFLHKPTGYEIQWYKYPLRDSYANRAITPVEFLRIVFNCLESLRQEA
jgi:hypothetical protein